MTASDSPRRSLKRFATVSSLAACAAIAFVPATAAAGGGGVGTGGGGGGGQTTKGDEAKLRNGKAIAPESAPRKVKLAIKAANKIAGKPYKYGGGHGDWKDRGYDCSGAVSYAIGKPGARILRAPEDSSGLARWGDKGKGEWMTVYANGGHAFVEIAGLRFDTSQTGDGDGPDWSRNVHKGMANGPFKKRSWNGL